MRRCILSLGVVLNMYTLIAGDPQHWRRNWSSSTAPWRILIWPAGLCAAQRSARRQRRKVYDGRRRWSRCSSGVWAFSWMLVRQHGHGAPSASGGPWSLTGSAAAFALSAASSAASGRKKRLRCRIDFWLWRMPAPVPACEVRAEQPKAAAYTHVKQKKGLPHEIHQLERQRPAGLPEKRF